MRPFLTLCKNHFIRGKWPGVKGVEGRGVGGGGGGGGGAKKNKIFIAYLWSWTCKKFREDAQTILPHKFTSYGRKHYIA